MISIEGFYLILEPNQKDKKILFERSKNCEITKFRIRETIGLDETFLLNNLCKINFIFKQVEEKPGGTYILEGTKEEI